MYDKPLTGFSRGESGLAQGRVRDEGEPDPDLEGSELSYASSPTPSMVKSG